MNLRTLRYLVSLAETRHFGRAAQRCFVSQPTLSAQIKRLEDELGVELVERRHKNVLLTDVGERVVERARGVVRGADEIVAMTRHFQDPLTGRLALGFIPTLGPYLLPHIVGALNEALPQMQFYFGEYQTEVLIARLLEGKIDMAVLALPHGQGGEGVLEERVLFSERFVVALPVGHPLAQRKRLRAEHLQDASLLLLEDGHCLRDQALAVCPAQTSEMQGEMAATSLETLRQMVAAGQGVTLLPELAVAAGSGNEAIAIRPFTNPQPTRQIGAVWRHSSARGAAIAVVCEQIAALSGRFGSGHNART